jgi:hypothetical protein
MLVRRGPAIVLSLVLSAAALALAPSAVAGDGGTVKDVDKCDKDNSSTKAKLKVSLEPDNRFEVVGIVWSDDEDVWDWKFRHNGGDSADGDVKAKDADKSFKVTRSMVNFTGPDTFVFRAENRRTGEVCRADLVY